MKKNKPKLLVVDDMLTVREAIQYYFEGKDYIILTAASAGEALPIIKEENPDIMLSDINLPQMSGIDLIKSIRQFNNKIKIIIVSGCNLDLRKDPQLKTLDISDILDKPVDFEKLEAVIKKAVV
jgi:CheY-like chemotaxis protein